MSNGRDRSLKNNSLYILMESHQMEMFGFGKKNLCFIVAFLFMKSGLIERALHEPVLSHKETGGTGIVLQNYLMFLENG